MTRRASAFLLALVCCASLTAAQYTGLSGYYDYQTNGRSAKYFSSNPANGHVHAILMTSQDSVNYVQNRGTYYAYSTNGGWGWNTFNELRVPSRSSWFPSLALGKGVIEGATCIVNQSSVPTGDAAIINIDWPEGGGAFAELSPLPFSGDPSSSPDATCAADGSIVAVGVRRGFQSLSVSRSADYASWSQPTAIPSSSPIGDRFVVESNSTGRVGIVFDGGPQGLCLWESTNNGITWPAFTTQILPEHFPVGADTFALGPGLDLAYSGNTPLVMFGMQQSNSTTDSAGIGFWSSPTGFVQAVPHSRIPNVANKLNRPQVNHLTAGYPSIGTTTNNSSYLFAAFQAFVPETSASGFNYSKVFSVGSTNSGFTWGRVYKVSNSSNTDDRYPSTAKRYTYSGPSIIWQQDPEPGSFVAGDNGLVRRVRQRVYGFAIEGVETGPEVPGRYILGQNFPNPFNPSTTIKYMIPVGARHAVSLRVYDLLGREVATLVNEVKGPGTYTVSFDGTDLPSGVYFYRLNAGEFIHTQRMLLLR